MSWTFHWTYPWSCLCSWLRRRSNFVYIQACSYLCPKKVLDWLLWRRHPLAGGVDSCCVSCYPHQHTRRKAAGCSQSGPHRCCCSSLASAGLTIFKMGIKCKVKYLWPSHWLWREWPPASLIVISNDTLLPDKGAQFWKFLPFPPIKIMWPFLLIFLLNLCAGAATGARCSGELYLHYLISHSPDSGDIVYCRYCKYSRYCMYRL